MTAITTIKNLCQIAEEYSREIGLAEFVVVEQIKDRWDKPRRFLVYTSGRLVGLQVETPLALSRAVSDSYNGIGIVY